MKYYLHDSNSFNDEKITELFIKFGYEGLGLFYTALEKFASQEKPIKTIVLKKQLNIGKRLEKCWNFLVEIGLIQTINDESFNERILNFAQKYQIKNKKNAERISQWREKQEIIENVTHYTDQSNADKVNRSKVKESKVNKSKEIVYPMWDEFLSYGLEKEYTEEDLKGLFDYYTETNWCDAKGKKVLNWKAKLISLKQYKKPQSHGTAKKSNGEIIIERHNRMQEYFRKIDELEGRTSIL
jgi:hypothetical protein